MSSCDEVLGIRDDEDGNDSSSLSSYDSDEFGLVARNGFARMYVLSRTMQSDDAKDSKQEASVQPGWNLLYASGQHYFHGPIELPEEIPVREEADEDRHQPSSFFESLTRRHAGGVELVDIPRLLPLLHAQHDSLTAVDDVAQLSSSQRDAVYQMLEVGEFVVEELAKSRTTERLERGAQELPWLAEATQRNNPAFFELQTHPNTNHELAHAGVRLVVMKLVVRGVLLDIIYSRDSYFVTLRDNVEEIALQDTFVPNVANTGPCYLVRRYSDEDLKQLLLWCPLPTDTPSSSFIHQQLTSRIISSGGPPRALAANNTQLYCLLGKRLPTRQTTKKKKNASTGSKQREEDQDADETGDLVDDAVVFQFNQFVYQGSAQLPTSILNDPGALTTRGFPLLRTQANALAFACVYDEILEPGRESEAPNPRSKFLSRFAMIHYRFQHEIGSVLVDLLVGAQKWVKEFLAQVPTASDGDELIATHLARWLESEDGSESFFELEMARGSLCPFTEADEASSEQQPLDLMVWKGFLHDALLSVIYRRGSFFLTLKPLESSDVVSDLDDVSVQLFADVPLHLNRGRGYLVRCLPSTATTPTWLAGAKLLLWQTNRSLEREEQDEAECKTPCKGSDSDAKAGAKTPAKRCSMAFADDKRTADSKADKVARPHHIPRLSSSETPWDLRTGRPL